MKMHKCNCCPSTELFPNSSHRSNFWRGLKLQNCYLHFHQSFSVLSLVKCGRQKASSCWFLQKPWAGGVAWEGRSGVGWGGGVGYYFTDCCQVFFNRVGDFCALIFYNLFLFSLKDNTQTHTRYSVQPMNRGVGLK